MTDQERETLLLTMIASSGEANAKTFDAMDAYLADDPDRMAELFAEAEDLILTAHQKQTIMLQHYCSGEEMQIDVLMAHAMDICANAANQLQYTKKIISVIDRKLKPST